MTSATHYQTGFSLLQTVLGVVIVLILAAMLASGLGRFRAKSENVRCVVNLRSLGGALLTYVTDHNGYIPPLAEPVPPALAKDRYWHMRLWANGYVEDREIYFCPSFAPRQFSDLQRVFNKKWNNDIGFTYGMREWSDPANPAYAATIQNHKKLSLIEQPGDFFLLADSILTVNPGNLSQGYIIRPVSSANWQVRLGHDGRANAFFADGHVGQMSRDYVRSIHVREAGYTHPFGFSAWSE